MEIIHMNSNDNDWLVIFSVIFQYPSATVDYTPRGPLEITFPAGSTRQEYTVDFIEDNLPENYEYFNADVNIGRPKVVIGSPKQPLIEIQDLRNGEWLKHQNCNQNMWFTEFYAHVKVHMHALIIPVLLTALTYSCAGQV